MSFWNKSSGQAAEATLDQEGAESGKLVQIPDNTMVHAVITDIEMSKVPDAEFEQDIYEYDGYRVTWNIIEDGEYNGVNVRQAIRVLARQNNKRDQALDVLAFMDLHMNKGQFMQQQEAPDIQDMLDAFANKPMLVKIRAMAGVDEATGRDTYNQWVSGVFRKKPESAEAQPNKAAALDHAKQQMANKPAVTPAPKANGPRPNGPAAGPRTNGPATGAAGGETAAEKRARLQREQEELAREEAAEEEARKQDAQNTQQLANDVANQMEGVENNDEGNLGY